MLTAIPKPCNQVRPTLCLHPKSICPFIYYVDQLPHLIYKGGGVEHVVTIKDYPKPPLGITILIFWNQITFLGMAL